MYRGMVEHDLEIYKAQREDAIWNTAWIVAMIHNTTRTESRDCKPPLHFYSVMTGKEPPVEIETEDDDDDGSLAQAKAERREREAKAKALTDGQQTEH